MKKQGGIGSDRRDYDHSVFYNAGANQDSFEVVFGQGVTYVPAYLFATARSIEDGNFARITSVTIPSSVTAIGAYAFYNCHHLTSTTIYSTSASVGENAFSGCADTFWLSAYDNTPAQTYANGNNLTFVSLGAAPAPEQPGTNPEVLIIPDPDIVPQPSPESKTNNTIKASNIVKSYKTKKQIFKLNAMAKGGAKLTYKSSNPKKAKVKANGQVTITKKFSGTVKITITSAETNSYKSASKTITITVPTVTNVKKATAGKAQMTVQWKKNTTGKGYDLQVSLNKDFKKGTKTFKIKKNKTVKTTIKKLKKDTYYVRIRTVNGRNYSDWSKTKTVKVTK